MKTIVRGSGLVTPYGVNSDNIFGEEKETKTIIENMQLPFYPGKLRRFSRFDRIMLSATMEAINDFNPEKVQEDLSKVGLILTTSYGALHTNIEYTRAIVHHQDVSPLLFVNTISNSALGNISILLGLKGVSSMMMGANVIMMGMRLLDSKKARYVLVGGGDEYHDEIIENTSCINNEILNQCEGAGVLLLENIEDDEAGSDDIIIRRTDQRLPYNLYENEELNVERMSRLFGEGSSLGIIDIDAVFFSFSQKDDFFRKELAYLRKYIYVDETPIITLGEVLGKFMGGASIIAHIFAIHCMKNNRLPVNKKYYYGNVTKAEGLKNVLVISYEKGGNIISTLLIKESE